MAKWIAFVRNESGATAIEFALIAAGISIAIVATVQLVGGSLTDTYSSIASALN